MESKRTYPKIIRVLIASFGTAVLGLLSFPVWAGLLVGAHYFPGPRTELTKLLAYPFLFTLMMTVLIVFVGERFLTKGFETPKRFLILPAIIIVESILFGIIFRLLQIPYLWLDRFEPVNVTLAMIIVYPSILIIAALIADVGLTVYNKYVIRINRALNKK